MMRSLLRKFKLQRLCSAKLKDHCKDASCVGHAGILEMTLGNFLLGDMFCMVFSGMLDLFYFFHFCMFIHFLVSVSEYDLVT